MIAQTRQNFIKLMEPLSIETLNQIPTGFNNNIIWNFAHIIVTQQLLVYKLSGLQMHIDNELVELFRKGSKPTQFFDKEYLEMLKDTSNKMLELTERDYKNGVFKDYKTYPTSFGVELNSVEDAIKFNHIHEGMHYGYVLAMRRALNA